jgi:hypothetical protein
LGILRLIGYLQIEHLSVLITGEGLIKKSVAGGTLAVIRLTLVIESAQPSPLSTTNFTV